MQDHPVLGQVALGYSPIIDRQRSVLATRLTVFPQRPDVVPDAPALLRALELAWPVPEAGVKPAERPLDPGTPGLRPAVSLNLAGEQLLLAVMTASPGTHLMLEVPAFMASDPVHAVLLGDLRAAGNVLLIKGRPLAPLSAEVQALFSHSIVEAGDDRRAATAPAHGARQVSSVQAGARTSVDIDAAFQRGAVAVLGWPADDPPPPRGARSVVPSDIQLVMELINGVEAEAPMPVLEGVLRRDPTLAFRLMRYLNSPAFGLSVEISSISQALMLLGYQRLKRWLSLLLASSSRGVNARPLMYSALRRGLLMEELGREQSDAQMSGEMFICGVFSLLDQLLHQPMAQLLGTLPVPERVQQALRGEGGPHQPYLDLVRAIESESVLEIRELTERLLLSTAEVNHAVLKALCSARQLDG